MNVGQLEKHLNEYLKVSEFEDYTFNGLNVGKRVWEVTGIITATDYDRSLVDIALERGANVIIVHHGLWWGKPYTISDEVFDDLSYLMKKEIALLAYHLPLDVHPDVGNNAFILGAIGVSPSTWHPLDVGFFVDVDLTVADIIAKLESTFGMPSSVWEFRGGEVRRMGVISGSGGSFIDQLVSNGIDTFITGEVSYPQWREFRRYKINLLLYGHYRSETGGPRLLASYLERELGIKAWFEDIYDRAL